MLIQCGFVRYSLRVAIRSGAIRFIVAADDMNVLYNRFSGLDALVLHVSTLHNKEGKIKTTPAKTYFKTCFFQEGRKFPFIQTPNLPISVSGGKLEIFAIYICAKVPGAFSLGEVVKRI